MIRLIFICFIFLGVCSHSTAQNFKAGLIAGISTSQVSGDQLGGFNKIGVKFGASVNHSINPASRGQLALYYIDKGSNDVNSNYKTTSNCGTCLNSCYQGIKKIVEKFKT